MIMQNEATFLGQRSGKGDVVFSRIFFWRILQ